jgi:hypothetical protein
MRDNEFMIYAIIQRIHEFQLYECTMETLSGLGKVDRERIASIIRGTKGTISVKEAAEILGVSRTDAAKMLARWCKKGWFSRVKRGLYIPVPLESRTSDVPLEDPWLIAERVYSPCYIGGWSAAEHWDLTEQIFRTVVVMTTQKPRERRPTIKNTNFYLKTISDKTMFGLKSVWRALKEQLEKTREFLSTDPRHEGRLKIPIGRMVAFPNITQQEFRERGLHELIPPERALFKEGIVPDGPIVFDTSGQKFIERISPAFPFRTGELSQKDLDLLHFSIYPEINLPERKGIGKVHFQTVVQALDGWQARVARRLKGGHQIIKGPPGSGKTLALVHRCCHLSEYQPKRNILFVCFNIALVSYLKRLLQEKGLGVGKNGIRVCHFFELCSDILQEPVHFEQEGTEYYDLVKSEALERVLERRGLSVNNSITPPMGGAR